MEVEESGFCTSQTTIHCGNICLYEQNKLLYRYIVQVCANGVWLMEGLKQIQHIPLELGEFNFCVCKISRTTLNDLLYHRLSDHQMFHL